MESFVKKDERIQDPAKAEDMARAGNVQRSSAAFERKAKFWDNWEENATESEKNAEKREEIAGMVHDLQALLESSYKYADLPSMEKINALKVMVEMAIAKPRRNSTLDAFEKVSQQG